MLNENATAQDNLSTHANELLRFTYETVKSVKSVPVPKKGKITSINKIPEIKFPLFITLIQKGHVVGCMGSFQREKEDIFEEIDNYIKLIFKKDRRSKKLNIRKPLKILLTFPTAQPFMIKNLNDYNPKKDGLFIQTKGKGIVIVPDEVKSKKHALSVAMKRTRKNPESLIFSKFHAIQFIKVFSLKQY